MQASDISGARFGRLVAVKAVRPDRWVFRCDCGGKKEIRKYHVTCGATVSCGCVRSEKSGERVRTHGMSGSTELLIWRNMMRRCFDKRATEYSRYGARGITVCDRWQKFENFFSDMGARPMGRSLDRIDNDGDYNLKNCRWATGQQQGINKRPTTTKHGYGGIQKHGRRFVARYTENGVRISSQSFSTALEAHEFYLQKRAEIRAKLDSND